MAHLELRPVRCKLTVCLFFSIKVLFCRFSSSSSLECLFYRPPKWKSRRIFEDSDRNQTFHGRVKNSVVTFGGKDGQIAALLRNFSLTGVLFKGGNVPTTTFLSKLWCLSNLLFSQVYTDLIFEET